MSSDQPARFPTTAWSVVQDAKDWNDSGHLEAMNRLVSGYWKPVFCFVRARGQSSKRVARQSDFERKVVSVTALIRDHDRTFEPPDNLTPEKVFMKQWAQAVIRNARRRLETWCHERGRPDWYEIFLAVHFPTAGQARLSQQALADRLRLSRDQIRYGLEEAERQFRCLLRAEVADQVGNQADTDQEIEDLFRLMGE